MNKNYPVTIDPEERAQRAMNYFHQGYNCCQAVVMAFDDIFSLEENTLAVLASGFGGGMGRMREVCGAFSACVIAVGFISPATDPSDMQARTSNYSLVREFADRFREDNGGSIICRELLGLPSGAPQGPAPSQRTESYYRKRPCERTVGNAARIIALKMNNI